MHQPGEAQELTYATPMDSSERCRIHAELDQILVGIVPEKHATNSRMQRYRWLDDPDP